MLPTSSIAFKHTSAPQPDDHHWAAGGGLQASHRPHFPWFGFRVLAQPPSGPPTFRIDEDLLDAVYSTRLVSPPRVSLSLSLPGVYFVGMYGAFNGDEDGADIPALGVRTETQFPTGPDTGFGTFQPFAIVVPWENG